MSKEISLQLLDPESIPLKDLTYVVIGARENDRWVFVRHKDRETWELPAGHIEKSETAREAALRELYEETGINKVEIYALHDYSVDINDRLFFGRIYYASVKERLPKPPSEIAEIQVMTDTPLPATYPEAHSMFMEVLEKHLEDRGQNEQSKKR
ncbi:MAG: NUDIX domain-containing protein [Bacteroidales bacterium]|nr:NUDIX domain-containing protein [Bacteroidales bacterium]